MTDEEKADFMSNLKYYWNEKGSIGGFTGYSQEKLDEADPALGGIVRAYQNSEEVLNRLLSW